MRLACLASALVLAGCGSAATYTVGVFRPIAQDRIVPPGARLEVVWADGDFTEGPAPGPDGAIYFSDIGNRILRFDPATGRTTPYREPSGRANGLMFDARGRLVACEGANGGGRRISISDGGEVRTLADRWEGKRFNSPNDLAIAPNGNLYFTDPRYVGDEPREIDFEGVFLVRPDGSVEPASRELQKPNGILVSADGSTAYVADNNSDPKGNHHLVSFRVAPDGALIEKRVLFDFGPDKRGIDGMTLDTAGNIYATAGRGAEGGVYVFNPRGEHLAFIATPGDPTNCVFGRGAEASTLYVTAGGPPDVQQRRFGLYRIRLAATGYHVLR